MSGRHVADDAGGPGASPTHSIPDAAGLPRTSSKDEKDVEAGVAGKTTVVNLDTGAQGLNKGGGGLVPEEKVRIGLQQRHIQMISLADSIGTGLFLGSGKALAHGGPLGILLGYAAVGSIVIGVVLSLAEMAALVPVSGSYVRHATIFFDPALGFASGWNLIYSSCLTIPSEIIAASVLFQYWTDLNSAVFISIFILCILAANLFLVRIYGEIEFGFAMLKIMLVVGLIIFGICIDLGAGPNGDRIGFRYWHDPGPFAEYLVSGPVGKLVGFWAVLTNAAYAYSGSETIAMAAAETRNPRRAIPRAAKSIFFRLSFAYMLGVFVVGLIVPSNDRLLVNSTGTASQSPFVVAAQRAGVKVLPSIVNAVVITSAWSTANASMLGSSRTLYGLALDGGAPKIFARVHRFGVPYMAVLFVIMWSPLAYTVLGSTATKVFGYAQALIASLSLVIWMIITGIYLRFYTAVKAQNISRDQLPYKSPFQPYLAWFSFIFCTILLLTGGFEVFIHGNWSVEDFFSAYFVFVPFTALYFGYKVIKRTEIVPLHEAPIQGFIDFAKANPEPEPKRTKGVFGWLRAAAWG